MLPRVEENESANRDGARSKGQSWNASTARSYLVAAHAVGKPARLERSPLLEKFDPGGARHATDSPIRSLFYKRRDAKERVSADTTGTRSRYLRFLVGYARFLAA